MSANLKPDLIDHTRLRRLSVGMIVLIIVAALLVGCGWQWDVPLLRSLVPGLPAMNPLAALCFLLASFSFLILTSPRRSGLLDGVGYLLAVAVFLAGAIRLAGYLIPSLAAIDHLLFASRLTHYVGGGFHGRMAFNTALSFVCWAIALVQLGRTADRPAAPLQTPTLLMAGLGLLSIIGYLYGVRESHGFVQYLPMAANTAACVILAAFALLFTTTERGLIRELMGPGTGSLTARRLIPFAFAAPIVLGWLRLFGSRTGAFSVEFGVSILVLSIIGCFVFMIWYNAKLLNRREDAQRKAQEALSENERTFGLLIGNIKDYAIFMVDPAGRIKSWNPGAQAIKGYTAGEVVGQPISIFYTPEALQRNAPAHNLHMAEKDGTYHSEGWRVRKNGSRFWADIVFTALYDSEQRLQGFAKITRDMSGQKKANDMIRYQARLMEDISDAIISTDTQIRTVSWNKAAEKLYGYSLAEALGQDLGVLLRSSVAASIRHAILEQLREQSYWHGEQVYYTKNNVALNVLLSISAIRDEQNIMTGYVVVCRDITERLRAEQRLIKFNEELSLQVEEKTADLRALASHLQDVREEERAEMAREIHDELGQQLTGLKMDMAWVDEQLAEEHRPALRQRVADTLQLLDHTIMTVRKIAAELRPGILDDLGLLAAVEWQAEEFEKRSGIHTWFHAGMPGRRYPAAMSIGLFRICQEALTNVGRHSGARNVDIFLGYYEDRILLRVGDDGKGLDPAGSSGKRKTLGLLGMKERALMMGGTLEIFSEPGKGMTLTVSVPISVADKPE